VTAEGHRARGVQVGGPVRGPDQALLPVAVVGATGYAGGEAVRILAGHPRVRLSYLASHTRAGLPLAAVQPHLRAAGDLSLAPVDPERIAAAAEVAVLALPAGASAGLAPDLLARGCRVVDLGPDFRLKDGEAWRRWYRSEPAAAEWRAKAVYGLPEVRREEIAGARLVAVPGCYPTAAILALWPALASGLCHPEDIIIDAKSGVSGAGSEPTAATHFCEADENVTPYALAGAHRHTPEIEQELSLAAGGAVTVSFNPHLVPLSRGLLCTCYARLARGADGAAATALYREWYRDAPFVQVLSETLPSTKPTAGANACHVAVRVDGRTGRLVACAAIDNLQKGAAGQGVQALNLMAGWDETAGLGRLGMYP
jgi:N-acetyl-gamma-glutamyl-phosphate reductase